MRYSSAVVLSTIAVGQAAAANLHNRHASFHARRQAEAKRSAANDVDWNSVAYDLKDVNWDEVNWSSVLNSPAPTPTVVAQPTATPEQQQPEPTTTQEAQATTTKKAAKSTSAKAAESTSAKAEATASTDDIGDAIGDAVSDFMQGVKTIAAKLGCKTGKNDESNNGGIWIGDDSDWTAEFINDHNEDAVLYCWKADGFSGMSINVNTPDVSVGLQSGQSVKLSFAPNVPAACSPIYSSTKLALFGGVDNTWFEATFGEWGAFDVSRNVNMKGTNISSKGSKCTSNMDKCVFKCTNGQDSCESGSDYDLFDCDASSGGGGGYDAVMAGTGGGCSMGSSGEEITVVFS